MLLSGVSVLVRAPDPEFQQHPTFPACLPLPSSQFSQKELCVPKPSSWMPEYKQWDQLQEMRMPAIIGPFVRRNFRSIKYLSRKELAGLWVALPSTPRLVLPLRYQRSKQPRQVSPLLTTATALHQHPDCSSYKVHHTVCERLFSCVIPKPIPST